MKQILAIGEALLDMAPSATGKMEHVPAFFPKVGGAPANVLGAITKLGGEATLFTKLGADPFGDKIVHYLEQVGINTGYIQRTSQAPTALAFVSLLDNGQREFQFYRSPSADMLLDQTEIPVEPFMHAYALHFCSVSLVPSPMKDAHDQAIDYAKDHGVLLSFDPNLRLNLWQDHQLLRETVLSYLPKAHVVKLADEELPFLFGSSTIEDLLPILFQGQTQCVIYTKGANGAQVFTRHTHAQVQGIRVRAVDTTGAGDGFIGSFLYQLNRDEVQDFGLLDQKTLEGYLDFSNRFCAYSVQKNGTIESYPTMQDIQQKDGE